VSQTWPLLAKRMMLGRYQERASLMPGRDRLHLSLPLEKSAELRLTSEEGCDA